MAFKKFDATNAADRQSKAIIAFHEKGLVSISSAGVKALALRSGDKFALLQDDKEERNWYLILDENGFKSRTYTGSKGLFFSCRAVAQTIIDLAGESKSVSCRLITTPVIDGEQSIYPIIIPKPVLK